MPPAALVIDQGSDSQAPQDADGKGDFLRGVSLIGVDAALHHRDRRSGERAHDQAAAMALYGRPRKMRDVLVGECDRLLHLVRE